MTSVTDYYYTAKGRICQPLFGGKMHHFYRAMHHPQPVVKHCETDVMYRTQGKSEKTRIPSFERPGKTMNPISEKVI
jgi:hypothetical protein